MKIAVRENFMNVGAAGRTDRLSSLPFARRAAPDDGEARLKLFSDSLSAKRNETKRNETKRKNSPVAASGGDSTAETFTSRFVQSLPL
jgi:hypothetical protein